MVCINVAHATHRAALVGVDAPDAQLLVALERVQVVDAYWLTVAATVRRAERACDRLLRVGRREVHVKQDHGAGDLQVQSRRSDLERHQQRLALVARFEFSDHVVATWLSQHAIVNEALHFLGTKHFLQHVKGNC